MHKRHYVKFPFMHSGIVANETRSGLEAFITPGTLHNFHDFKIGSKSSEPHFRHVLISKNHLIAIFIASIRLIQEVMVCAQPALGSRKGDLMSS